MKYEALKKRRLLLDLTIEELAERVQVSAATLSRWERNKRTPRKAFLKLWRQALNLEDSQ